MDFFSLQDSRKKQSVIILLFFIVAMLSMAVAVHVIAVLISVPVTGSFNFSQPSMPAKAFIVFIWITCLIGCFFRVLDVSAGGATLARRFGAVEADSAGRYRKEQELVDVVNEIAVASACEMPRLYILHREQSINAFVVGGFRGKEALVVSQGAVDKLNRDELAAVVAHEFGHISQGDIPLNMRLLVALGGLNAIDEVGKLLMLRSNSRFIRQPGLVVGFVIRTIGSVGVLFGRIVRAAFSRQREYLADACAVQFTRNPEHLAAALSVVRDEPDDKAIHSVHAEELTHLCFQVGEKPQWYAKIVATHPPVQKRIDAIDPNYAVKKRAKTRVDKTRKPNLYSVGNGAAAVPLSGAAANSPAALSDMALMMMGDSVSCLAVLHAIFVSDESGKSSQYYNAIAFAYNKVFAHSVRHTRETLSSELHTNQIAIIDFATTQLRDSIKLENRQRLLQSLEKLLIVEGDFTLMNYATLQLIRRKLDAEFPVLEKISVGERTLAQGSQVKTFDTMGSEFALLLSLIVESSGNNTDTLDDQFQTALKCYTKEHHQRRSAEEPGIVKELEASFQTLYVQPRPIRDAFVMHCLEISQADGHIAQNERALLDLFAASLNCEALAA